EEFYKVIGAHQFRGTSQLCRAQKAIFTCISLAMANRMTKQTTMNQLNIHKNKFGSVVKKKMYKGEWHLFDSFDQSINRTNLVAGTCQRCKEKEFTVAPYVARMNHNHRITEPKPLKNQQASRFKLEPFLQPDHYATRLISL